MQMEAHVLQNLYDKGIATVTLTSIASGRSRKVTCVLFGPTASTDFTYSQAFAPDYSLGPTPDRKAAHSPVIDQLLGLPMTPREIQVHVSIFNCPDATASRSVPVAPTVTTSMRIVLVRSETAHGST